MSLRGMSVRIGVLLRHEDETGVSGAGIVADVVEFPDGLCIAHWRSTTPSTLIFPNLKQMIAVHGHRGKTEAIFFAELPAPEVEQDLVELLRSFSTREEEEPDEVADRLLEEAKSVKVKGAKKKTPDKEGDKK